MRKLSLSLAAVAVAGFVSVANAALADGGAKFLGNITTGGQIRSDFAQYWNQITPENGCKWGSIHSLSNGNSGTSKFAWDNFDKCESAYKWAKEKPGERHFKFHALVWGSQYPNFLCKKKNPGITVELTKKYITEWFDAVAAKFPDLEYIDVVNEAIWAGNNYHSGYGKPAAGAEGHSTDDTECGGSYIIEALGGDRVVNGKHQYDFITNAFKMARERWPKAVLIYNDYNTLSWQINEGIELIQTIVKNGAPVDAYGQQAHDCKGMSKSDFESKMTRIHNETGLPLLVSEYDIGEADDTKQKNDYANQIPFMWETPWVAGITIWGYINGSTWVQNTGLIEKDGRKRASMNWLEDYFAKNLSKGKNDVTFAPVEPEPQLPFKGEAIAIPGKVEAEDFDIPGVGVNEDGTSNQSYSDDSENHGDSDYRKDDAPAVDLYNKATGVIVGYNQTDDWLEYTVNIAEAGKYVMTASVAAESESASFSLSIDGKSVAEVPVSGSSWDDYKDVTAEVTLPAGKHILRMDVTAEYFDVDYFNFEFKNEAAIRTNVHMATPELADYDVFDVNGVRLGRMSAYSLSEAVSMLKNSNSIKIQGVYMLRSVKNGAVKTVRITR
ncbi:carbohydrate-binding protein [Fibrobacter sp. UWB4]|uniref:endo-1,4-beta-xylanase n=1 Tax=Fibrobacter sp. UWB4 TaxID=1964356 RepID=UPI000B522C5E|nr:endo-1,4-beta-xylanase [Fibrobacter sp. UWB4]OWV18044.1 carbohydrate-binding protein [Fibrobacter sp. UWB4]